MGLLRENRIFLLFILVIYLSAVRGLPEEEVNLSKLSVKWLVDTISDSDIVLGYDCAPTVGDPDQDGFKEFIFGIWVNGSGRLLCMNHSGELEWVFPPLEKHGLLHSPAGKITILDCNDRRGIVFVDDKGSLHCFNADTLETNWVWDNPNTDLTIIGLPPASPACTSWRSRVEFFVSDPTGNIYCVDDQGQTLWNYSTGNQMITHPTISSRWFDHDYDLLWTSSDGFLHYISTDFTVRGIDIIDHWNFDTRTNLSLSHVVSGDFEGDDDLELIFWGRNSIFCIGMWGVHPSLLWRWDLQTNTTICNDPVIGDLDGNGKNEIIIPTDNEVICLELDDRKAVKKWETNLTRYWDEGILPTRTSTPHSPIVVDIDADFELEVVLMAPYPIVLDRTGVPKAYYTIHQSENTSIKTGGLWWGDLDSDNTSELISIAQIADEGLKVYCLTLNGSFPSKSYWPEYYHSAQTHEEQKAQPGLYLVGGHQNSLWFPPTKQEKDPLPPYGLAPRILDIPDIVFCETDKTEINLGEYVIDPDTPNHQLVWSMEGNQHITFQINPDTQVATLTVPDPWYGSERIRVIVRDQENHTTNQELLITVLPNTIFPPEMKLINTQYAFEGDIVMNGSKELSFENSKISVSIYGIRLLENSTFRVKNSNWNGVLKITAEDNTTIILENLQGSVDHPNPIEIHLSQKTSLIIRNSSLFSGKPWSGHYLIIDSTGKVQIDSSHMREVKLIRGGTLTLTKSRITAYGIAATIQGKHLNISDTNILCTGDYSGVAYLKGDEICLQKTKIRGSRIQITSNTSIKLQNSQLVARHFHSISGSYITLRAPLIETYESELSSRDGSVGTLTLDAQRLIIIDSEIETYAHSWTGSKLTINAETQEIQDSTILRHFGLNEEIILISTSTLLILLTRKPII